MRGDIDAARELGIMNEANVVNATITKQTTANFSIAAAFARK